MADTLDTVEHRGVVGNTKTTTLRTRGWCFTLNNYTEEEKDILESFGHTNTERFIVGREVGTNGTPHLQGYMYFKNAQSFDRMRKVCERAHWEKAKGTAEQNYKYCSKDGDLSAAGMEKQQTKQEIIKNRILDSYKDVIWKEWQQAVLETIEKKANSRTINWVYDPVGNTGKTFLRKYIALTKQCIICDGKKDNVLNQLKTKCIDEDMEISMILMDVPRHNSEYINYGLLEQLKDGHVYSGKYEGGEIWLDAIHVIVFSNEMPDMSKFSHDRWNIISV